MNMLTGFTQNQVKIVPLFEGKPLNLNTTYWTVDSTNYTFSTLRFYISHVKVNDAAEQNKVHLFDLEDSTTHVLSYSKSEIRSVEFLLGTDSLTNVSGILDGPLDPIFGMYWSWNSGYINFKIEGKSNFSPLPDNSFEYHIGGYIPPHTTSRHIKLNVDQNRRLVRIELHLDAWLKGIEFSKNPTVMIPGPQAAQLVDQLVTRFKLGYEE